MQVLNDDSRISVNRISDRLSVKLTDGRKNDHRKEMMQKNKNDRELLSEMDFKSGNLQINITELSNQ